MSKVIINTKNTKGIINKNIYGQFAEHLGRCIYEGLYVGEDSEIPNTNGMRNDVVEALKELDIPVLRWPGGCFADDYHWRDGIGDKDKRPYMVNTNWGGVVENNHFGTHEFFDLCEQLGCEPYITGNVGSGTVKEMRDWIEYMTFDGDSPLANERRKNGREKPWKLKYFGVGNENWGCGGGMRPEYYSDLYRQFRTFIRDYGDEPIYKVGCGANANDTNWTKVVLENAGHCMDGISWHNYTYEGDWNNKGSSYDFDENGWYSVFADVERMRKRLNDHIAAMDYVDPDGKVDLLVDEWGNWYDVMPGTNPGFLLQQNTMRDAVSGMVILHMFHEANRRVKMANIAQMVNVLQAMVLTEGERIALTPTYHLFKMMKGHHDGTLVDAFYDSKCYDTDGESVPKISVSPSIKDDILTTTIANTSLDEDETLEIELDRSFTDISAQVLTADNMCDFNSFDEPDKVVPKPLAVTLDGNKVSITVPAMSIAAITLK
ncbi:MAG: alpha-N-arabinofuranosidase [Oscillospiraceae bacterium]|nr:alpha-N-arabinofuranosidase [Oscillospiraceae bacterium]